MTIKKNSKNMTQEEKAKAYDEALERATDHGVIAKECTNEGRTLFNLI